jgi:hypothetical protein
VTAVEQRNSQIGFKRAHLLADRRMGDKHSIRRRTKRFVVRNRDQRFEQSDGHVMVYACFAYRTCNILFLR